MKLSVSNIAWGPQETDKAYELLQETGVRGLEVAPGILFSKLENPLDADPAACDAAKLHARAHGLEFSSMQSLLFGVETAAMFESLEARTNFLGAMGKAIALAGRLGMPNLVFGSPKNRIIPASMNLQTAQDIWCPVFRDLGNMAADAGTCLALEPNPTEYGTNFMVTLAETISVARQIDHPSVRVNLDLGALILTGEIHTISETLTRDLDLFSHVHISVPYLASVVSEEPAIRTLVSALLLVGYENWISIEMSNNFSALSEAIKLCQSAGIGK